MNKFLKSFKKDILDHAKSKYGKDKADEIWKETEKIYYRFLLEIPYIGGSENFMSHNLYQSLVLFAYYEATGRDLSIDEMETAIVKVFMDRRKFLGKIINLNKVGKLTTALIYKYVGVIKKQAEKNRGGKWHNTWGIEINPDNHKKGLAMTLVGCPIADFAKEHGYLDIMPVLCKIDHTTVEMLHGKLIRHHTVAEGYDKCDYWIIGDKDTEEE